jgi:predicted  nucleic acid-binding Zn-ribbon protein
MNAVLQNLVKLQALEFGEVTGKDTNSQAAALRGQIPQPFLGHYDRLRAREKKSVAAVRNQVCTGCHMRVPIGTVTVIMRDEDIQLCENCGRYLYIPTATEGQTAQPTAQAKAEEKPVKKAAPKARKRKTPPLALAV